MEKMAAGLYISCGKESGFNIDKRVERFSEENKTILGTVLKSKFVSATIVSSDNYLWIIKRGDKN
jgi:hypothetical protein